MRRYLLPAALVLAVIAGPAAAHTGHEPLGNGLMAGLLHPLMGLDHLLAMVMVGLWAAQLGGRTLWQVPAAFVVAMALGAALALAGVAMPVVEGMILTSVMILGLVVAAGARVPVPAAMGLVALFALFHGAAHGQELPALAGPVAYVAGFLLATSALHAAGIFAALSAGRWSAHLPRITGGMAVLGGVALAVA